jgi:hypothetical protein
MAAECVEDVAPDALPARFVLERVEDVSGVSGTGIVVEGVRFTNGWCMYRWRTPVSTVAFAQDIADIVHVHGHDGRTRLVWVDPRPEGVAV